jgi:hypothetical protein
MHQDRRPPQDSASQDGTLKKHAGGKKALVDMPKLKVFKGEFDIDHSANHVKNKKLVLNLREDTVISSWPTELT